MKFHCDVNQQKQEKKDSKEIYAADEICAAAMCTFDLVDIKETRFSRRKDVTVGAE